MTEENDVVDDDDISVEALAALTAAQQQAEAAGLPQVYVENRELVYVVNGERRVLEVLPPRRIVTPSTKYIKQ